MSDALPPEPATEEARLQLKLRQQLARVRGERDPDDLWLFVLWAARDARRAQAANFQDLWAFWESGFKRDGWFVEIGAADGKAASNSWFLEQVMGWSGALAEPNPAFWASIEEQRTARLFKRAVHPVSGLQLPFLAT